jgi:hypothetical protein
MHSYQLLASFSDFMIENGWKWLWVAVVLSLAVAIRDTPDIWRKIKEKEGCGKIWPVCSLSLHWLVVVITTVSAISSQLGSEKTDKRVDGIDPINWAVSDIVGNATVTLPGKFPGFPMSLVGIDRNSSAVLMESNAPPYTMNFGGIDTLYAGGEVEGYTTTSDGPPTHSYVIELKQDTAFHRGPAQVLADFSPVTTGMVLQRMSWVQLKLAFVAPKSEIVGGFVELKINGTHKMRFGVPRQFCDTSGAFYATNSP